METEKMKKDAKRSRARKEQGGGAASGTERRNERSSTQGSTTTRARDRRGIRTPTSAEDRAGDSRVGGAQKLADWHVCGTAEHNSR